MIVEKDFNIKITDEAKEKIWAYISNSELPNPVPSIGYGKWDDEEENNFNIGLFDKSDLSNVSEATGKNTVYLTKISGVQFLIIQTDLIPEMEGKTLDLNNGKIIFVE